MPTLSLTYTMQEVNIVEIGMKYIITETEKEYVIVTLTKKLSWPAIPTLLYKMQEVNFMEMEMKYVVVTSIDVILLSVIQILSCILNAKS